MPAPVVYGGPTMTGLGGAPVTYGTGGGYGTSYNPYGFLPRPTGGGGSTTSTAGNSEAEAFFRSVMQGQQTPFSPFTQNQMLSQQSDMTAAAENARNQQLSGGAAAGGASANDPSLRAARMGNMAMRQTANQQAARDISANAAGANFGARMDAASQLNQNALQRQQWWNQMNTIPISSLGSSGSTPGKYVTGIGGIGSGVYQSPGFLPPTNTQTYGRFSV